MNKVTIQQYFVGSNSQNLLLELSAIFQGPPQSFLRVQEHLQCLLQWFEFTEQFSTKEFY